MISSELIDYFDKIKDFKRLCRVFKTRRKFYFYDVGTGKIFEISKDMYSIIEELIEGKNAKDVLSSHNEVGVSNLSELKNTIDTENILQAPILEDFVKPNVRNVISSERQQLILEVTESCNMRCKYCYYNENGGGYRTFGSKFMTFEIAKAAIDEFLKTTERDDVSISFYGGEPLLNYKLIKNCIEYINNNYPNKKILYAMTTNGTLITDSIAKFFSKLPNVLITISLDGPKEMHDKYRVFTNGKGTYDNTIRGIEKLVKNFGTRAGECLSINTVLPEYDEEDLDRIDDYFNKCRILPKGVGHTSSFVSKGNVEFEYEGVDGSTERYAREKSFNNRRFLDPLYSWATEEFYDEKSDSEFEIKAIAKENLIKDLAIIHRRSITENPMQKYYMNGCCIPGSRRYYVTTEGEYLICERLGASPNIGNIKTGLDAERINKYYIEQYDKFAKQFCKKCWAIHLCSLCYMNCYDEKGINLKYRHKHCIAARIAIEKDLILYHEFLESNSEIINQINSVQFT